MRQFALMSLCAVLFAACSGGGTASSTPPQAGGGSAGSSVERGVASSGVVRRPAVSEAPCSGSGGQSFLGGGASNVAAGQYSSVVAGSNNYACDAYSAIDGGGFNQITSGESGFIGGGSDNTITNYGISSSVVAGDSNTVRTSDGFIGAGNGNVVSGENSGIVAGQGSIASGEFAAIGGGYDGSASGEYATVAGGNTNSASGVAANVAGGANNVASGGHATVLGGSHNTASGSFSLAAGLHSNATTPGSFVWTDESDTTTGLTSTTANQFLARAAGGFTLWTNAAATVGATLAPGSGAWASTSDRNMKTNIVALDDAEVLDRVGHLPISTWSYVTEHGVRHMGPMAQDFYAAFNVGEDDRHITAIDEDGVALASIKALRDQNALLRAQQRKMYARETQMQREIARLGTIVEKLTR